MNSEEEKIERWLENALGDYARLEPRPGLESRILAQLRAAPALPGWHWRFAYTMAAMVTLCVMAYGIWCVKVLTTPMPVPAPVSTVDPGATHRAETTAKENVRIARRQVPATGRHRQPEPPVEAVLGPQLPAPQQLSNQERLLLALVRENPKEAASTIAWQEEMRRPPVPPDTPDQGEQQ